tara:strand:+ start:2515 stop:2706 length:192 start_codon:yes stop_codon:yes gene_type:complete
MLFCASLDCQPYLNLGKPPIFLQKCVRLLEKYVIPESAKCTLDRKIEVSGVSGVERCGSRTAD